ncbi:MAG: hypothetical protein OZ924_07855 [Burkholderiaceae bacterium]|nr:hypothetical protein [Burkholderiaceae bacterium]
MEAAVGGGSNASSASIDASGIPAVGIDAVCAVPADDVIGAACIGCIGCIACVVHAPSIATVAAAIIGTLRRKRIGAKWSCTGGLIASPRWNAGTRGLHAHPDRPLEPHARAQPDACGFAGAHLEHLARAMTDADAPRRHRRVDPLHDHAGRYECEIEAIGHAEGVHRRAGLDPQTLPGRWRCLADQATQPRDEMAGARHADARRLTLGAEKAQLVQARCAASHSTPSLSN